MKKFENTLKALADGKRIRILKLLSERKLCVCEIATIIGVSQPAISKHLKKLKIAGLINSEQDGLWTNYYIPIKVEPHARMLLRCVKKWLAGDPLIRRDLQQARNVDKEKLCCPGSGRTGRQKKVCKIMKGKR